MRFVLYAELGTYLQGGVSMAREYIEREAALKKSHLMMIGNYTGEFVDVDDIKKIPSADVVEVVRCKNCKHCDPENGHCDHILGTSLPFSRKSDDYCSYGERRVG